MLSFDARQAHSFVMVDYFMESCHLTNKQRQKEKLTTSIGSQN